MEEQAKKNIIDRVWELFSSVKLAIVIFSLIAITSIVGTVIEQEGDPAKNLEILSKLVGESAAPLLNKMLFAMGFMDMYRSWWFVTLLLVFDANILICSIDRFPKIWKLVKEPLSPVKTEHFKALPIKRELRIQGKPDKIKEALGSALKGAGFKFKEASEEKGWQLYGRKGRIGRLGVFITHLSIIIIMIGALIGITLGFKGALNLPEGGTYTVVFRGVGYLTQEEIAEQRAIVDAMHKAEGDLAIAASSLGADANHLLKRMRRLGVEPLGFGIKLEDFNVDFYGKSDLPKEFTSLLSVIEDRKKITEKWIEVNDPLKYKGYTFYQSSYGVFGEPNDYLYILKAASASGNSQTFTVKLGEKITIPGTAIQAEVTDFSTALSFDSTGKPLTYTEMMNNPAARLSIIEGGSENSKWILKRYPATWSVSGQNSIQLVDVWGAQYTGLQVRRDPGVWIVYAGCLIMSIGLYIAFFISDRRIWINISGEKGTTTVLVAGSAHKGREGFERSIDRMLSLLREGGK